MMVKVHYDHRRNLEHYLKYSRMATPQEYQEYLNLFASGVGGQGFHECMNFWIKEGDERVLFYLPPGYIPSLDTIDNGELCIFFVTYQGDEELPSNIIGFQARCTINADGNHIERTDIQTPDGIDEKFIYHGYSLREYSTLFTVPLPFDVTSGYYMQALQKWGNGLRYNRDDNGIQRILIESYNAANERYDVASIAERTVIERQLVVTENAYRYYFNQEIQGENNVVIITRNNITEPNLPDKELGALGEQIIFDRELDYAAKNKIPLKEVEWVAKAQPYSPFDIRTKRLVNGKLTELFLEVKTTRLDNFDNVYISSNQVDFADNHKNSQIFVFVNINDEGHQISEYTIEELRQQFSFMPIKYKLKAK